MTLPLHEKVLSIPALLHLHARPRSRRIVFTNGCFDLLHRGHVEYLFAARALGDALVVGLNTDDSVRRIKGPGRPVTSELDRAIVLAGLACVDAVTFFEEDTPRDLIAALLPDVLVKGGDYKPETLDAEERGVLEKIGAEIRIVPFETGYSTSRLIEQINCA